MLTITPCGSGDPRNSYFLHEPISVHDSKHFIHNRSAFNEARPCELTFSAPKSLSRLTSLASAKARKKLAAFQIAACADALHHIASGVRH